MTDKPTWTPLPGDTVRIKSDRGIFQSIVGKPAEIVSYYPNLNPPYMVLVNRQSYSVRLEDLEPMPEENPDVTTASVLELLRRTLRLTRLLKDDMQAQNMNLATFDGWKAEIGKDGWLTITEGKIEP